MYKEACFLVYSQLNEAAQCALRRSSPASHPLSCPRQGSLVWPLRARFFRLLGRSAGRLLPGPAGQPMTPQSVMLVTVSFSLGCVSPGPLTTTLQRGRGRGGCQAREGANGAKAVRLCCEAVNSADRVVSTDKIQNQSTGNLARFHTRKVWMRQRTREGAHTRGWFAVRLTLRRRGLLQRTMLQE